MTGGPIRPRLAEDREDRLQQSLLLLDTDVSRAVPKRLKGGKIRGACLLAVALGAMFSGTVFARRSAPKTEIELTLRNCTKIGAMALFGGNAQGCLIYDVRKKEASVTFEVCGGLMLKLALKEVVLGGEFAHEKIGCLTVKTVLNPADAKEASELLTSGSSDGEALRKQVLDALKAILSRASDQDLKDLGISRDQIDQLERLKIEKPRDATDRSNAIKKSIERCPAIGPRQVS